MNSPIKDLVGPMYVICVGPATLCTSARTTARSQKATWPSNASRNMRSVGPMLPKAIWGQGEDERDRGCMEQGGGWAAVWARRLGEGVEPGSGH